MSMNLSQIRDYVVQPALEKIGLWSIAAERLVIGTGLIESRYEYLAQINGPALGPFQMEPETANDIWENYLAFKNDLRLKVISLMADQNDHTDQLAWNWQYAAAMCRIKYVRSSVPLPDASDIQGMAKMWKQVYNSGLGAGDSQTFYSRAVFAGIQSL